MGVNAHKRVLIPIHKGLDGFIMDASAAPDGAKPEDVRAMIRFRKEYGVYG
jgi:hypothetical protein